MLELKITSEPMEGSEKETDAEHASVVSFVIYAGDACLTSMTSKLDELPMRNGPFASSLILAEWFAHNWWRIRHEDKPSDDLDEVDLDWWESHNVMAASAAYVLPCMYIWRKDDYINILSKSDNPEDHCYIYYYGSNNGEPIAVSLESFDEAVDSFLGRTLTLLEQRGFKDTDYHVIFRELAEERSNPELAQIREEEARSGKDPEYEMNNGV